jgi:hypothetical protein
MGAGIENKLMGSKFQRIMSVSIFGTRPPKTLNLDCAFSRHLFGDQGGNELRARSSWESVTSSEKIDAPILLEMERPY